MSGSEVELQALDKRARGPSVQGAAGLGLSLL